jgi:hypothetical protein
MMPLGAIDKLVVAGTDFDESNWSWVCTIIPALENMPKDDAPMTNKVFIIPDALSR